MDESTEQRAEQRLQEVLAERARLWDEVHRLRSERRDAEHYERLARTMTTSLSWRITAPLRSGKVLATKVRRKLDERSS